MSLRDFMDDLHSKSESYSIKLGVTGVGLNDSSDAFRHAWSSAVISRDYGLGIAENLGYLLEIMAVIDRGSDEEPASKMDVWNNQIGREIQISLGSTATDDQLADAVKKALDQGRLIIKAGGTSTPAISPTTNSCFVTAKNWVAPRDPLVLDLDGGGISTSAINPNAPIYFDQNGNGIRTATGWISAGEALVVRDLNGNGLIDSGRELFGDSTLLTRSAVLGQTAANGFTALADLDSDANGIADGLFNNMTTRQVEYYKYH